MKDLIAGLSVMYRVVFALIIRETKTIFGRSKLGYVWALIQPAFFIGVFWTLREVLGARDSHGIPIPVYLMSGFIPWFIFSESINSSVSAVKGNRALLTYPQVFPIDLMMARVILKGTTQTVVMIILLIIISFTHYIVQLSNPNLIMLVIFVTICLGASIGVFFSSLNLLINTTERVLGMILRVLFFTSGIFFSIESLPTAAREILYYNPLCHLIALMRSGFSNLYDPNWTSWGYVGWFILISLFTGLLLERYSRRYIE